ncbi:hypothetical protein CG709_02370, partial [Lachnotalea glycerini]
MLGGSNYEKNKSIFSSFDHAYAYYRMPIKGTGGGNQNGKRKKGGHSQAGPERGKGGKQQGPKG